MSKKSTVITLRVPEELAAKIALAVEKTGRDQSDILRESVGLGMSDFELVGFDPIQTAREKIAEIKEVAPNSLDDVVRLPIKVSPQQFDKYTRAFKLSKARTFREWLVVSLDAVAAAYKNEK